MHLGKLKDTSHSLSFICTLIHSSVPSISVYVYILYIYFNVYFEYNKLWVGTDSHYTSEPLKHTQACAASSLVQYNRPIGRPSIEQKITYIGHSQKNVATSWSKLKKIKVVSPHRFWSLNKAE